MPNKPQCILFDGLGGAGQRHLRILRELLPDARMVGARRRNVTPVLNPDFSVSATETMESRYGIELFPTFEEAYAQAPDLAVIATPTAFHARDLLRAVEQGIDVLVEKPGAATLTEAREIVAAVKAHGVRFCISYQRRFHPLVDKLRGLLHSNAIGELMFVRVAVGSYVPAWHPYEDFRQLYACSKELGGGVLRTEIHELDLITMLFGSPLSVSAYSGRFGGYDIDVEDTAAVQLGYEEFVAQLNLCFMQQKQERTVKFFGRRGWMALDLLGQQLHISYYGSETDAESIENRIDNDEIFRRQARFLIDELSAGDHRYCDALERNAAIVDACRSDLNE